VSNPHKPRKNNPEPRDWTGGRKDFTLQRTFDGHIDGQTGDKEYEDD
jgi:hypothetical protein